MNTKRLTEHDIDEAAAILRDGGLLGIPTETVYGLGANGLNEEAVAHIFEAKGRPQDNPLILHIPDASWLERYCKDIPLTAYQLAEAYWPGPMTMILKRKDIVPNAVTAGLDTVGMRCPAHPLCREIIAASGVPVAAPSGNTSGRPSPTTAQHMLEDMDGKIDAIVDGGPCSVGVESTIIDLTETPARLLRPGGITLEQLETVLGEVAVDPAVTRLMGAGEQPKAPGMKYRHYAPKAPVTVVTGAPEKSAQEIARRVKPGDGVICFDEFAHLFKEQEVHTLGPSGDKLAHSQRVFDALRTFDNSGVQEIYAQCPDNRGLGLAVGNRLKKAAGFHVIEADSTKVVLGLTGGTGAGKTSALRAIESMGGTVIDCDALYHDMLEHNEDMRNAIHTTFPGVFSMDGRLDRQRLGKEVFEDKDRLEQLNAIVYQFLRPEISRRLEAGGTGLYAIDAINLLESGADALCDRTVAITSPLELRVRRIMARDGISEQYARLRISAQKPDEYYRSKCDCELNNGAETAEAFQQEAREFFERLVEAVKEEKAHGQA